MRYIKIIISALLLFSLSTPLFAQDEKPTLDEQFKAVIKNNETFKKYKVVPITELNQLFATIKDSVKLDKTEINSLNAKIAEQQNQISTLTAKVSEITKSYNESVLTNDSIDFMGMGFQKGVYSVLVWSIILIIAGIALFTYILFKRSNLVTKSTQRDLRNITDDFESFKIKSHEKQVKLKRELQTAMNTLHEKGLS